MVMPRLEILDDLQDGLNKVHLRQSQTFRVGKLLSVDANGAATVQVAGRFGTALVERVQSLIDSPERFTGLKVWLVIPSGQLLYGAMLLGVYGAVVGIADTTVLSPEPALFLEGRDRLLLPDVSVWTGTGNIPANEVAVIEEIVLVTESLASGTPVLRLGDRFFREGGHDGQIYTLRPAAPFRAEGTFPMTLTVDRQSGGQIDDAVLLCPYTVDAQPPTDYLSQRLRVTTNTGYAGTPVLRISGRMS